MSQPTDKKLPERERRQERLARQLRVNLLKRKAQSRARAGSDTGSKGRPAGNGQQDA
jgi:hypothetical protein